MSPHAVSPWFAGDGWGEKDLSFTTSVGFVPGTVVCLAFLDGFGVTDLGALVLFSSLGPGVSLAEFWSGNLTKRSGYPLVFFIGIVQGGNPASVGQVVNPASSPGLWVERGKPSI